MDTQFSRWVFGQVLNRASRHWRRAIDQALLAGGATQATALPLLILARHTEDARQGFIADELGIEGPSLVRIVEQLVLDGLVERREDPSDRRAKLLRLTRKGEDRACELETTLDALRGRLLAEVSNAELAVTVEVLNRIESAVVKDAE